jgi:hypothetical protein
MNTNMNRLSVVFALLSLCAATPLLAQLPKLPANPSTTVTPVIATDTVKRAAVVATDSTTAQLDQVVAASAKGDNAATAQALETSTKAMDAEAQKSSGDFKDKLSGQTSKLKALIPMAKAGLLKGDILTKAIGFAKTALAANRLSGLLGGGSGLVGKAAALTGGLNLMKGGLGGIGGSALSGGSSLIDDALGSVGKLGSLGSAAEPTVKSQLGGVLNFAKGIL